MPETIDVSGLSPDAVRLVERFVASLRGQDRMGSAPPAAGPHDPWVKAAEAVKSLSDYDFAAWADQRTFDQQHGQGP